MCKVSHRSETFTNNRKSEIGARRTKRGKSIPRPVHVKLKLTQVWGMPPKPEDIYFPMVKPGPEDNHLITLNKAQVVSCSQVSSSEQLGCGQSHRSFRGIWVGVSPASQTYKYTPLHPPGSSIYASHSQFTHPADTCN